MRGNGVFLLVLSVLTTLAIPVWVRAEGVPGYRDEPRTRILSVTRKVREIPKGGGCVYAYLDVLGEVVARDTEEPIEGALAVGQLIAAHHVDSVVYHNFTDDEEVPANESRDRTGVDGRFELWFDACVYDVYDWDADFDICVTQEGFETQCLEADFDEHDFRDDREFALHRPTATPTVTATPTLTATPTATPAPLYPESLLDLLSRLKSDESGTDELFQRCGSWMD